MLLKRIFDIFFSFSLLVLLSPILLIISIFIKLGSKGSIFFRQLRVGLNNEDFYIYKFRTMYTGSEKKGLLTVGKRDQRITYAGYLLRKYKLDELPQLINVLNGTMSFVGPRPEVRKYVSLYTEAQKKVLSIKPGITDPASIAYANENELLAKAADPEKEYIEQIMPAKLALNQSYIAKQGLWSDLKIILKTMIKIISN